MTRFRCFDCGSRSCSAIGCRRCGSTSRTAPICPHHGARCVPACRTCRRLARSSAF